MIKGVLERIWFARFCITHRRSLRAQKRWQSARLRDMVAHAYRNVPLWRELFDGSSVRPEDIHSIEDLHKLPISSKETYLHRHAEEYLDGSRQIRSRWYVTSGTSGKPFTFFLSEIAIQEKYITFASLRFLWWIGVPLAQLATINFARIKIRAPQSPHRLFVSVGALLSDPKKELHRLKEFNMDVLSAYPSILYEISKYMQLPHMPRIRPRYILAFGETLYPAMRRHIEKNLGGEVYSRYGLEEIGVVGLECSHHDGFHIHTESVIIEIVDEKGRVVPDGTRGRVIATDLFNFGMPFIRYDTGDAGYITQERCACGLESPRIWIEGRYAAFLQFGSRKIHHLEFDGAMDSFMHKVFKYQIIKRNDSSVEVLIVPGPAYESSIAVEIRDKVTGLVGESVEVFVRTVEEVNITERGKCRIVIDQSV